MAKFTDYTQKTKPADADLLLIHDNAGAANKKTPFSGVWSWILDKLASAVISQLETTNKSIIPAINELNSKSVLRLFSDNDEYVKFASATAAKFFIVICSMGSKGINGMPAIAGVISTDYDGKLIDISQINTIDKKSINAEITDGNIIVKYLNDRKAIIYLTALVIRFK